MPVVGKLFCCAILRGLIKQEKSSISKGPVLCYPDGSMVCSDGRRLNKLSKGIVRSTTFVRDVNT